MPVMQCGCSSIRCLQRSAMITSCCATPRMKASLSVKSSANAGSPRKSPLWQSRWPQGWRRRAEMWKIKRPDAAPVADDIPPPNAVIREDEASIIASLHPHISQREEKLLQLRMAIHQALLDKINLSMLDKLPEEQIRAEITGILPELLASFDQPLNREERANLVT